MKQVGLLFIAGREYSSSRGITKYLGKRVLEGAYSRLCALVGQSADGGGGEGREASSKEAGVWSGLGAVRKWGKFCGWVYQGNSWIGRAD